MKLELWFGGGYIAGIGARGRGIIRRFLLLPIE
jgi:hypothetical protein